MSLLSQLARPSDVRTILRTNKSYSTNRDRAGAVIHDGLAVSEAYAKARPYIFLASLAGFIGSSYALYKRRARGPEAWWTWGTAAAACGATAWLTRPTGRGSSTPAAPGAPAESTGVIGYLDKRVAKLKAKDPNFADKAIAKLVALPSIAPQWQSADPLIKAAIL